MRAPTPGGQDGTGDGGAGDRRADAPRLLHVLLGAARGGVERDAAATIAALPDVRHDVLLLGADGPMRPVWERDGAQVIHHPVAGRAWRIAGAVARHLIDRPADGAIAWHGLPGLPQTLHACNGAGVPLLAHAGNPVRDMPAAVDLRYRLLGRLYPPRGPLPTFACCSRHVAASFVLSRYLRRFPTTVIYNGIELPTGRAAFRPFDPHGCFTIGMTARLSEIKDHATVLRAFTEVRRSLPHARLEFLGEGPTRAALAGLAGELGVRDAVRFLGETGDVFAAMAGWDLFAYATTDREGLGNAVSEALAFGLPCVVTETGPMREFLDPDAPPDAPPAVRLVPPADPAALAAAVVALARDDDGRRRLAEVGRASARRRFDPVRFARRHADLLGLPGAPPRPAADRLTEREEPMRPTHARGSVAAAGAPAHV